MTGPKTTVVPDLETYPLSQLKSLIGISPEAPREIQLKIQKLVHHHQGAFRFDDWLGNPKTEVAINIVLGTHPISLPMYGASCEKREVINAQINKWLEQDVIKPSKSPWAAPVVIVYWNGKPRFCVDYQKLNAVTAPDEFPIPCQLEILQALSGAQVLSTLDTLAGFNQLNLAESHQEKTGFHSHWGLHQFKWLPFGLRNGPSVFQRVMQGILAPFLWIFSLVYIDDIIIYSQMYEDHLVHLEKVLQVIKEAHITLSLKKCHFTYTSILLLGQKVSQLGLSTHHEKVQAITDLATLSNVQSLQGFLGMAIYFLHYILGHTSLVSLLFELLKAKSKWYWGSEQEEAFTSIKLALTVAPVLGHPIQGSPF